MDAGTTFLAIDPDSGKEHLWVVLSDPKKDAEKVLIVSLTTPQAWREQVCIVHRHEHAWLKYDSWVNYSDSKVRPLALLYEGKDKGLLKLMDSVSPEVLQRIRDAALESVRMPLENADVLIEQGLVDF